MADLVRLSFSLEKNLYDRLESVARTRQYGNRSEFIRDILRDRLVEDEWEKNHETLGTITLVYNHHHRKTNQALTGVMHRHHTVVLATTHIHLDEAICAEMIMLRGRARQLREIADSLGQQKGVLHTALSMSSTGKKLA